MALSNDKLDFATNFLTFLGFVGSLTVVLRYLNPWHEYLCLADFTGELRKMCTDYETEGALPRGSARVQLLRGIQCLEWQVQELVFIQQSSKFNPRAWWKSFHLKALLAQARILRICLLTLSEQHRRLLKDSIVSEQSHVSVDVQHLEAWFHQLSHELFTDSHLPYDNCDIPPVAAEHSYAATHSSKRLLPNRSTSSSSTSSNDTIVTPSPFNTHQRRSSHDLMLLDDLHTKSSSVSSLNASKKDSSWRHLVSRSRGILSQPFSTKHRRQRRSSSDLDSELPV